MFVLFFRHGDRGSGSDPSLSPTGQKQAMNLAHYLETERFALPDVLWVSPRRRAKETFEILARVKSIPLEVHADLDERNSQESAAVFRKRVQSVIHRLSQSQKNIFLCSHMDWLEEAMTCISDQGEIQSETFLWPAGGFIEFEINDQNWLSTRQGLVNA